MRGATVRLMSCGTTSISPRALFHRFSVFIRVRNDPVRVRNTMWVLFPVGFIELLPFSEMAWLNALGFTPDIRAPENFLSRAFSPALHRGIECEATSNNADNLPKREIAYKVPPRHHDQLDPHASKGLKHEQTALSPICVNGSRTHRPHGRNERSRST